MITLPSLKPSTAQFWELNPETDSGSRKGSGESHSLQKQKQKTLNIKITHYILLASTI